LCGGVLRPKAASIAIGRAIQSTRRDTSMNHKALLGTAVAAALMFGAQAVSACAISAWSSVTGVVAADAGESPAFKRYSGRCALRVSDASTPRFVTDITPNNETAYRVRFYYFTGDVSGATADIFQARNTGGTNIIRVTHNGAQLSFTTNTGGAAQTVTVADNAYYSIELNWAAGAGTGSLTGTVTGNSGGSSTSLVAGTVNFANLSNSTDSITESRMGIVAGAPTVTAPVFFDEFDSRRTTSPGRLCRGNAAVPLNGTVDVFDVVAIINDAGGVPAQQSSGQPDATENGVVDVFDAVAALAIAGGASNACP